MRRFIPLMFVLGVCIGGGIVISGCAPFSKAVDAIFGIDDGGTPDDPADDKATGNWFTDLVGTVVPWGDEALLGLGAIYAALRAKKWKQAAVATWRSAEEFAESKDGKPVAEKLKATLADGHKTAKVYALVKSTLDKAGINKPEPVPAPKA